MKQIYFVFVRGAIKSPYLKKTNSRKLTSYIPRGACFPGLLVISCWFVFSWSALCFPWARARCCAPGLGVWSFVMIIWGCSRSAEASSSSPVQQNQAPSPRPYLELLFDAFPTPVASVVFFPFSTERSEVWIRQIWCRRRFSISD